MQIVIRKWGNSFAVRLPQHVMAELSMTEGTALTVSTDGGVLVLKPTRPKYSLDDLLQNHSSDHNHAETDWDGAKGREMW